MQEKEIKYQGKKLFYRTTGEGPVVMLLHGFGENGTVWKNQFNAFPGYTLIIPDLPGSGQSEMIDDMSMEGMADAIREIIRAAPSRPSPVGKATRSQTFPNLEVSLIEAPSYSREGREWDTPLPGEPEGAILIGHSMGGYVALAFAEKYPELLKAFGLFHSTAYADTEQKKETRRKGIEFIRKNGAFEFLKTSVPNLYAPATKTEMPEKINEHLDSVRNFPDETLIKYYEAMIQRPDRTNVLKKTTLPVLFVSGRNDTTVPVQDTLQQCHMPQISYIHILEDAGHMGMIEQADASTKILLHFLKNMQLINL